MRLCFQNAQPRSNNLLHGCSVMCQTIPTIMTMWMRNLLTPTEYPYLNSDVLLWRKNKLLCWVLSHQWLFYLLLGPPLLTLSSTRPASSSSS